MRGGKYERTILNQTPTVVTEGPTFQMMLYLWPCTTRCRRLNRIGRGKQIHKSMIFCCRRSLGVSYALLAAPILSSRREIQRQAAGMPFWIATSRNTTKKCERSRIFRVTELSDQYHPKRTLFVSYDTKSPRR